MSAGPEKPGKKESMFPDVSDPKLFGHEEDAKIEEARQKAGQPADTRADWYGDPDDEHDKDALVKDEKSAVEEEQEELKGRRPE
ncbi:hypothetical protein A3A40_02100 [Candidatus Kaiserbacteria bacterium RIFCSPLOWO2_01_FULL_54_20]|uniref:Uncharacterized protein n=1 Tax=Candidatus Kaiserbacteria bacterium RIFCSPLOWO2_01_FULL_54_20 TaxID=1798513 RepID=A0A1F6EKN8_9BACT|nr:MAG: hypothetical protein A3A40_02100 [Candidatus Kaiserbacteria bacterium RIFCSPLOWO2_01_FULL_54_20]